MGDRSASGCRPPRRSSKAIIFTARNRGGHSSRPRPDNAIYDLSAALGRLSTHRFTPMLNETTRAYFTERAKQEKGALGQAMRAGSPIRMTARPPTRSRPMSLKPA